MTKAEHAVLGAFLAFLVATCLVAYPLLREHRRERAEPIGYISDVVVSGSAACDSAAIRRAQPSDMDIVRQRHREAATTEYPGCGREVLDLLRGASMCSRPGAWRTMTPTQQP